MIRYSRGGNRDNGQDTYCQVPHSFGGRTRRLWKPEILINPMEKDVAAKAAQGSILERAGALDKDG